jgi:hypothetical protein
MGAILPATSSMSHLSRPGVNNHIPVTSSQEASRTFLVRLQAWRHRLHPHLLTQRLVQFDIFIRPLGFDGEAADPSLCLWPNVSQLNRYSSTLSYYAFSSPFLTIVLFSSGIVGGTGPPMIFVTAPNLVGQASKQVPHFMHVS